MRPFPAPSSYIFNLLGGLWGPQPCWACLSTGYRGESDFQYGPARLTLHPRLYPPQTHTHSCSWVMESAGFVSEGKKCLPRQAGGGLPHVSPRPPSPLIRLFCRCQKEMGERPLRGGGESQTKDSNTEHLDSLTPNLTLVGQMLSLPWVSLKWNQYWLSILCFPPCRHFSQAFSSRELSSAGCFISCSQIPTCDYAAETPLQDFS